ncbi:hypothetical protein [Myceligenerans salitolerans]|uniref:Uncharacterized protein n=1 Tax=Myceligenerans salitolerans TaxID=1230528 RepID=A0ABS3I7A8_9MICO|nr:hypothetical protein [Myceligenerans salitolerans]MBO0608884.1 hypothetical protein [Myceligenerans salitolerans]
MSQTEYDRVELDVSKLRNALPASVQERLSDEQLRSGLARARDCLRPEADEAAVQGAAWLLAHEPDQRREQIAHMLQIVASQQQDLRQAEHRLLGAFEAEPGLDDTARSTTRQEFHEELDRAESIVAVMTARTGGTVVVTDQEMTAAPAILIERTASGLRVTTYDLGSYLDNHIDQ